MIQGSTKRYVHRELQTLFKSIPSLFSNNVYNCFITTAGLNLLKVILVSTSFNEWHPNEYEII